MTAAPGTVPQVPTAADRSAACQGAAGAPVVVLADAAQSRERGCRSFGGSSKKSTAAWDWDGLAADGAIIEMDEADPRGRPQKRRSTDTARYPAPASQSACSRPAWSMPSPSCKTTTGPRTIAARARKISGHPGQGCVDRDVPHHRSPVCERLAFTALVDAMSIALWAVVPGGNLGFAGAIARTSCRRWTVQTHMTKAGRRTTSIRLSVVSPALTAVQVVVSTLLRAIGHLVASDALRSLLAGARVVDPVDQRAHGRLQCRHDPFGHCQPRTQRVRQYRCERAAHSPSGSPGKRSPKRWTKSGTLDGSISSP